MVDGEDLLARIVDLRRPNGLELVHNRRRVVVGHNVLGADVDELPGIDLLPGLETPGVGISGGDLLDEGLRHVKRISPQRRGGYRGKEL